MINQDFTALEKLLRIKTFESGRIISFSLYLENEWGQYKFNYIIRFRQESHYFNNLEECIIFLEKLKFLPPQEKTPMLIAQEICANSLLEEMEHIND